MEIKFRELYENLPGSQQIATEGSGSETEAVGLKIKSIEYDDGVLIHYENADFPQKVLATPEAVFASNAVKRLCMEVLKHSKYLIFNPFCWKIEALESFIGSFNSISDKILSPFVLKNRYLSPFSKELRSITLTFLIEIGINKKYAEGFSKLIVHLLEYDNAYRLRVQDVLSETSKEQLQKPRKELKRLIQLFTQRETYTGVKEKYTRFYKLLSLLLLLPRFKKAFLKAINQSNFTRLQLDNADKYWACMRTDYNFMGLTYEQRQEVLKNEGLRTLTIQRFKL